MKTKEKKARTLRPSTRPRVFLVVEGGLVQSIAASEGVEVRMVDWDNLKGDSGDLDAVDPDDPNEFLCGADNRGEKAVDRYIQEARDRVRTLKKERVQ